MLLRRSAEISVRKENRATSIYYLSEIARRRGDLETAKKLLDLALSIPGLDPAVLRALQGR